MFLSPLARRSAPAELDHGKEISKVFQGKLDRPPGWLEKLPPVKSLSWLVSIVNLESSEKGVGLWGIILIAV